MIKFLPLFIYIQFLFLVAVMVNGCAGINSFGTRSHEEKKGQATELSPITWWKVYERALLLSDEGLTKDAMQDLQQAISGNDFDQWRLKTPDGIVIDYFPHREMGILYLKRQEYRKAIEQFEYSLESEESAKALFYLDRARAAMIAKDGLDRSPPEIYLETSSTREVTTNFTKHIKGVVKDDTYVSAIHVDGQIISLSPALQNHVFTADIPLPEGDNTVNFNAIDLSGKTGETSLNVLVDRQSPVIEITSAEKIKDGYTVLGNVSDLGGLRSLHINGKLWPITGTYGTYNFQFILPDSAITITARDRAGNIENVHLGEKDFAPQVSPEQMPEEQQGPAKNDSPTVDQQSKQLLGDVRPPLILLEGVDDKSETINDTITFKVNITDDNAVHSTFVNTVPVFIHNAKNVYFSCTKSLAPGKNEFVFTAFDLDRNKAKRKITVTRKLNTIEQPQSRMRIAVLPFTELGEIKFTEQSATDTFVDMLVELGRFQVAGKHETQLLKAQSISPALHNQETSSYAADHLYQSVDALLAGTINLSSTHAEITARLMVPGTLDLISFYNVFGEASSLEDVKFLLQKLAVKIEKDFPVCRGKITHAIDKKITINLGTKDGVHKYSRFLVYRDSPPIIHPVLKTVIQPDPDIIGTLQVTYVNENSAQAEIIESKLTITEFDNIIAK